MRAVVIAILLMATTATFCAAQPASPSPATQASPYKPLIKWPRGTKFLERRMNPVPMLHCLNGFVEWCDVNEECDMRGCRKYTVCYCAPI